VFEKEHAELTRKREVPMGKLRTVTEKWTHFTDYAYFRAEWTLNCPHEPTV
jgi:hypothetical protein